MSVCADSSFLVALYVRQSHSPAAVTSLKRLRARLPVTALNLFEARNAFSLLAFRQAISHLEHEMAQSQLTSDVTSGVFVETRVVWETVYAHADRLRAEHTATLGVRSLDILHVAIALSLGARTFLSFDDRQRTLAERVGLTVGP
jgi:predicted nucleic acid-binding protein